MIKCTIRAALACFAMLLPCIAPAVDETTVPIGNAADDPRTSEAVTRILQRCADAYSHAETLSAKGRYIEAVKLGKRETQSAAEFEIVFQRPDRMRVSMTSKERLGSGFCADGTTVTFTWPDDKRYATIAQPASLAAFAEEERAGQVADDESGTFVRTSVPALLASDDTLAWIHANVVRYLYEGTEKVGDTLTERVKFVQENPEIVVTNWIDPRTGLLRKVSVIMAEDDNGDFIDSYSAAKVARMQITIFDSVTTSPRRMPKDAFKERIPKDWQKQTPKPTRAGGDAKESLWRRMFRVAAAEAGQETTVGLKMESGSAMLRAGWFHATTSRVEGISRRGPGGPDAEPLAVALQTGGVMLLDRDGTATGAMRCGTPPPDILSWVRDTTGPLLVAASTDGGPLKAFRRDGGEAWRRDCGMMLGDLLVEDNGGAEPRIFAAGTGGLVRLNIGGDIAFWSRRAGRLFGVSVFSEPGGEKRLACLNADGRLGVFDLGGRFMRFIDPGLFVSRIAVDEANPNAPFLALTMGERKDIMLQRLDTRGTPEWTIGVAQRTQTVYPVGVSAAVLHLGDNATSAPSPKPRRVIATALSDGRLSLFTLSGAPVWRGKVVSSDPTFGEGDAKACVGMQVRDSDGDGADELYLAVSAGVLQVTGAGR
jgi:hypothetical protein